MKYKFQLFLIIEIAIEIYAIYAQQDTCSPLSSRKRRYIYWELMKTMNASTHGKIVATKFGQNQSDSYFGLPMAPPGLPKAERERWDCDLNKSKKLCPTNTVRDYDPNRWPSKFRQRECACPKCQHGGISGSEYTCLPFKEPRVVLHSTCAEVGKGVWDYVHELRVYFQVLGCYCGKISGRTPS